MHETVESENEADKNDGMGPNQKPNTAKPAREKQIVARSWEGPRRTKIPLHIFTSLAAPIAASRAAFIPHANGRNRRAIVLLAARLWGYR